MKKFLAALILGFLPWLAFGQSVDSSQIKLGTNKGLGGDAVNGLSIKVYRATSAPASPEAGNLWFDTTGSPSAPPCKEYDGSAWQPCNTVNSFTTVAALAFPGSPANGDCFIDWSHIALWCYQSANTTWYVISNGTGASSGGTGAIADGFTGSVITAPSGAITIASSATAGNFTSGTHACKVTFVNSTGGETDPGTSGSASVSITASKSIDLSALPVGGAGTSNRNVYCDQAGHLGIYFWVQQISNTGTTATIAGLSDANMKIRAPTKNYSAPLCTVQSATCAGWTVTNNTAQTTSGGCGSTGSSMLCKISHSTTAALASIAADIGVIASFPLTSYTGGDYTIQYRIVSIESIAVSTLTAMTAGTYVAAAAPLGGLSSSGVAFASGPISFQNFISNAAGPLSSSNVVESVGVSRTTSGGSSSAATFGIAGQFPKIVSFPFWVRIVKRSTAHNIFLSKDGIQWAIAGPGNAPVVNPTDTQLGYAPATAFNQFWLTTQAPVSNDLDVEIDTLTVTVN